MVHSGFVGFKTCAVPADWVQEFRAFGGLAVFALTPKGSPKC